MLVEKPRIIEEDGEIRVSARVHVGASGVEMPDTVWYRFPRAYRDYLNERSDPFAVTMLPVAMLLGEDMHVEGEVSTRLARGMREYQAALNQWWPQSHASVNVTYESLSPGYGARPTAVGCTCSGGVDSFYSVMRHLPQNEPLESLRVTHALIINGFNWDVDLGPAREFRRLVDTYAPIMQREGVELLAAHHNAQAFLEATGKVNQASTVLEVGVVGAALALGRLFRYFFVPAGASYRREDNPPHGFHPSTLPLLGSDDTEIFLDGLEATRGEKTAAIAEWDVTYDTLRVCWRPTVFDEKTGRVENCCRCPKCLRTMIMLDAAGALGRYKTFPLPLEGRHIRACEFVGEGSKLYYFDMVALARRMNRSDLERNLRYARFRSRLAAALRHRVLMRRRPGAR